MKLEEFAALLRRAGLDELVYRSDIWPKLADVAAPLLASKPEQPVAQEPDEQECFSEWANDHLTDGNGYAPISTYKACRAAFNAAFPKGVEAAESAALQEFRRIHQDAAPAPASKPEHPDDAAVDRFAAVMKQKLAQARAKGRGGWDDPAQCTVEYLSELLHSHVLKGDPVDVANFCMMLQQRGSGIIVSKAEYRIPHDFGIDLLTKLRKSMVTMGMATDESMEGFGANLEWHLYTLCRQIEGMRNATASKPEQEPLTESYVQVVPDKCDRIVWRGHYHHLPITSPPNTGNPEQQGFDAEFLSKRLGRVAKLVGVPMPDMTDEQIAGVAGTILGDIARKLELGQPNTGKPEAYLVDGRTEQGLTFDLAAAEAMADANCGNVVSLCRCAPEASSDAAQEWLSAVERATQNALTVFKDSCNHTKDAIDYMKAVMQTAAAPSAPAGHVRCNHCGWHGADADLVRAVAVDEPDEEAADVCPNCRRIGDLMDLPPSDIKGAPISGEKK